MVCFAIKWFTYLFIHEFGDFPQTYFLTNIPPSPYLFSIFVERKKLFLTHEVGSEAEVSSSTDGLT